MESGSEVCVATENVLNTFQPRASCELTEEDAREIVHNLTGFFLLLAEWDAGERDSITGKGGEPGTAEMH